MHACFRKFSAPLQFRTWLNASSNAAPKAPCWEWRKNLEDPRPRGANLRRSLGISITHSSCKKQTVKPTNCQKLEKSLQQRNKTATSAPWGAINFWCCLLGEVVLLQLCSMSRELCYTLLAKISKYGCQGLLSDTKPTRPKIDALLSGPVYLRTNHAMQGVQLLFFCFWHLLSPYRLSSSDFSTFGRRWRSSQKMHAEQDSPDWSNVTAGNGKNL